MLGLAFAFDACSFALSAWTQSKITMRESGAPKQAATQSVWTSVAEGLRHIARDAELRTCFAYWAAVAVLIMGPLHIALPVLASTQPGLGASALGLIVGAHGAGTLAGMVVAGSGVRLRIGTLGTTVLLADAPPTPVLGRMKTPGPASSVTWALELRPVAAAEGWWRVDSEAQASGQGYVNQQSTLWAPDGSLAAYGYQVVAVYA